MSGFPFMVDFNSLGFKTFENIEEFHEWVREARQLERDWRGDDFVLNAKVANPHVVDKVQADSIRATGSPLGYGLQGNTPTFGYRREHRGSFTLREYLATHQINWPT